MRLISPEELQVVRPWDYPDWDRRLLESGSSSVFHTESWARVLNEAYGYDPQYFVQAEGGAGFSVMIPLMEVRSLITGRRGVSLPFSDFCGTISAGCRRDLLDRILEHGRVRRWNSVEFRGEAGYLPETCSSEFIGHSLDLRKGEEGLFSGFDSSVKRNIRKSIKEGVRIKITDSEEGLRIFGRLNALTRKLHGLPPQPFIFFRKLHEHIIAGNSGRTIVAFSGRRPLAAAVFLHFGKSAVFKYGASDRKYQHLRANNLVIWEAIRLYSGRDYEEFHFGRTEPDNSGLIQFKSGWGAEEQKIRYFKYDFRRGKFLASSDMVRRNYVRILRCLPVPVLHWIGRTFYRHMG
ncbi:MAG: peptidoglycan bridge formation glycyltransferase FemA/FemB family protein [Syntrophales bacterium]|nr:peptidoglycan bridge formation glycyltransferase FemA/FemB family protein [Syntrophales bacterium]MDD5532127.1 peptidoglycan bridge formation glycyltransferase FemA/FemB family protein [Syntrophales bacterium]